MTGLAKSVRRGAVRTAVAAVEVLESRRLFAVSVVNPIADVAVRPGATPSVVSLADVFRTTNLNDVTGTVVRFPVEFGSGSQRVTGSINMELFTSTPLTTQNFLNYVNSGRYNNAIFHRSVPGFVIQAGGFTAPNGDAVQTDAPVPNEFSLSPRDGQGRVNVRGTVAMAKLGGNPNSATSQWFINLADNSSNLDNQNGGFTTFGRVFSGGMVLADQIAGLQRVNAGGAFTDLPVAGYSGGNIETENLVVFKNPSVVQNPTTFFTYTVASTDTQVVNVTLGTDNNLNLAFGNRVGTSTVTVTATDLTGASVTATFAVTVASPNLVVQFNNQNIQPDQSGIVDLGTAFTGQTATRQLLLRNNGTGAIALGEITLPAGLSLASSVPATLAAGQQVLLQLSVDTSEPRAIEGQLSIATDAVNAPGGVFAFNVRAEIGSGVVLGAGGARSVVFTDADGTRATFTLRGPGSARLNFSGEGLSVETVRGVATVTGTGVTLTDLTLSLTTAATTLNVATRGGDNGIAVGTLSAESAIRALAARGVTVTSALNLPAGVTQVQVGGLRGATAAISSDRPIASLQLGAFENSNLSLNGSLRTLTALSVVGSTLAVSGLLASLGATVLNNATVVVGDMLGNLTVRGGISESVIRAGTAVSRVTTPSFVGSSLTAGLSPGVTTPTSALDFVQMSAVRQFAVTGRGVDAFSGSTIVAANLGRVSLGQLTPAGADSGVTTVAALQITGRGEAGGAFSLRRVTLGDAAQETLAEAGVSARRLGLTLLPLALA